ncbi:hypothetical protein PHLCEN_2v10031 [Hermanssonia centrifuga]|uniref:Uncharacterized protein n=1 Tax=Hermanssonia centrifuga TaxID=98765 RepID=A0A2R6NP35_9APHY|nr:hypothetical protein PHLCEN_2v10031 [Hermanssonia centrifuga]
MLVYKFGAGLLMNTMWNVDYLGRQCSNDLAAVVEGVAKGLGHDEEQCAERGMALHEGGTAALLEAVMNGVNPGIRSLSRFGRVIMENVVFIVN